MRKFFEEHTLNSEALSKKRVKKIKSSVLSRVEEDKHMKKRKFIKPAIIAAAVAATMALSVVTVNAATNGEFLSRFFKAQGSNSYSTKYGDIFIDVDAHRDEGSYEYKISYSYSDDYWGISVKSYEYDLEEVFGYDVSGKVEIWVMHDGGAIGHKIVFETGEISPLSDVEIQDILENYMPSKQRILTDEQIQTAIDYRKALGQID